MRPSSRQEPIRVPSRQEVPRASEIVAEMKELGERVPSRIRVVSRPASRAKEEEDWEWDTGEGEWEGYEGERHNSPLMTRCSRGPVLTRLIYGLGQCFLTWSNFYPFFGNLKFKKDY